MSEPDSGAGVLLADFLLLVLEEGRGPCPLAPLEFEEFETFLLIPRVLPEAGGFFSSFLGGGSGCGVISSVIAFVTYLTQILNYTLLFLLTFMVSFEAKAGRHVA